MAASRKTRIKVGVIGLGIIGSRVAAGLRGAGHQVYVWSRSPHSAPNFLGSVVEVADLCDVLQVFVSDDDALLDVVRTVAAALRPRHVFCAHATVSPGAAKEAAAIVESVGARYLDAPFTGSRAAAQNRQLVYYVGGSKEALEEARPVLEVSSKSIVLLGEVGNASVLKIATNMLTAATVQTLAEALALVRAAGVDGQRLVEAFEHNGTQSPTAATKLPAMIARNFEANFSLKHMLKDVRLARKIAEERQVTLPVTNTIEAAFAAGIDAGWGDEDFCGMTRAYDDLLTDGADVDRGEAVTAVTGTVIEAAEQPQDVLSVIPAEERPDDEPVKDEKDEAEQSKPEGGVVRKAELVPIGSDPAMSHPRKRTLRIIRDLFKPA